MFGLLRKGVTSCHPRFTWMLLMESYVILPDGTIGAVGAARWNKFACENAAPELLDDRVVGRNLSNSCPARMRIHISGDFWPNCPPSAARCASRHYVAMRRLACGICARLSRRSSRAMNADSSQSIELESHQRPPIDLYDVKEHRRRTGKFTSLPLVVMCSWCLRVQSPTGDCWITAENYYAAGGRSEVRISHGICEACVKIAFPDM